MFGISTNYEKLDFDAQLFPTMSELKYTGSSSSISLNTILKTTEELFCRRKGYLKNCDMNKGDQNITILSIKTGLFTDCFAENSIGKLIRVVKVVKINTIVPLRVCSISELRCFQKEYKSLNHKGYNKC